MPLSLPHVLCVYPLGFAPTLVADRLIWTENIILLPEAKNLRELPHYSEGKIAAQPGSNPIMKSNWERKGAIRSNQERSGAMGSKIERPITEDLESARSTRSDQER